MKETVRINSNDPETIKQLNPNGYSMANWEDIIILLVPSGYGGDQTEVYEPQSGKKINSEWKEHDLMYYEESPTYSLNGIG
jgi:hypothetical protein